ncbi:uncharacterized protein BDZ99DRAFT_571037 [Mytilinidion resinicola]|uniref:BTB domain-containing protein n=1 Tax=Mytilinidion resinicola TaxID=574789 RepID=A0A6A6YR16_9PEZI|nr:uncharacterized protein BDZ99DRAFT_571037 [Mytilinidion resinicola]KAF2810464.1 hypothetical protein BDZ99DRAFT_571037 [Mytilinidion resinicola]
MASAPRPSGVIKRAALAKCKHAPQNRMRDSMSKTFGTEIVTVRAGPGAEPFHIHRNLIAHWSRYFHNAFKGGFREAEEKEITLDDVEPWLFKIVMEWLYTQRLVLENRKEAFVEVLKRRELNFSENKNDKVTPSAREYVEVTATDSGRESDEVTVMATVPEQDQVQTSEGTDEKRPFLCFKSPKDDIIRDSAIEHIKHVEVLLYRLTALEDEALEIFAELNWELLFLEEICMDIPYTILYSTRILKDLKRIRDLSHTELPDHIRVLLRDRATKLLQVWQSIPYLHAEYPNGEPGKGPDQLDSYSVLVDLYIFADKYDFPQLRYDIIDAIHVKNTISIHFVPDIHALVKAFDNLPSTSGLYRYLFETWACDWDGQHRKMGSASETIEELLPKPLVFEIMIRRSREMSLVHKTPKRTLLPGRYEYNICQYHDHPRKPSKEPGLNAAVGSA